MIDAHAHHARADLPDERLALPLAESVLLWCMRVWVFERTRGRLAGPGIGDMLADFRAQAAEPPLTALMAALNCHCIRMIDISCVCCRQLSADERCLLEALSLAQARRPFETLLILRSFVSPSGAEAALAAALVLSETFARAGRPLSRPAEETRRYARPPALALH